MKKHNKINGILKKKRILAAVAAPLILGVLLGVFVYKNSTREEPGVYSWQRGSQKDVELVDTHLTQKGAALGGSEDVNGRKTFRTASAVNAVTDSLGCRLELTETASPTVIKSDSYLDYAVSLKNTGAQACSNAGLSVYYGNNEEFISSSVRPTASDYYWFMSKLEAGEEFALTIRTKHNSANLSKEVYHESCAATYDGGDSCASNIITIDDTAGSETAMAGVSSEQPSSSASFVSSSSAAAQNSSSAQSQSSAVSVSAPTKKEFGSWVWISPAQMTEGYIKDTLAKASAEGINVLYVTIDDYLNILDMTDSQAKEKAKNDYVAALERFIAAANGSGIEVDAEAGWRNWAAVSNRSKGYSIIDFAINYNKDRSASKLRGFQYDVEPYLLPNYEKDKADVLKEFVEFIDYSVDMVKGKDLEFSIVVPHFYDSEQGWTPAISYKGQTKYVYTHLLDILEKKPGSSIIIMAYRNFAEGVNGAIDISEEEIKEAAKGNYSAKVIVAQETGNVEPSYVTFFGTSKSYLFKQIGIFESYLNKYSSYGGKAIHYMDTFTALK